MFVSSQIHMSELWPKRNDNGDGFHSLTKKSGVNVVFVAGTEAHRLQGRISATLLAFPKMDAGATTAPSIFQAEEKQEGTGAYITGAQLTRMSLVTFFWPELCP